MEVTNNKELVFVDVSSEAYRAYTFPSGAIVRINEPVSLNVSKGASHRVLDAAGMSHYIPSGWVHLEWKVKDGEPAFSF